MFKNMKKLVKIYIHAGRFFRYTLFAGVLSLADLAIKEAIDTEPSSNFPRELNGSNGKVEIKRLHNPGFNKGRCEDRPELVKLVSLSFTSMLVPGLYMACREKGKIGILRRIALSLALAGGISNTFDRIKKGYVVDFIHLRLGPLKKLVINFADIMLFIGSLIYMIAEIFHKES